MNYSKIKNFRRKIKKKIPKLIKDYIFSIHQIPKRFKNYKLICKNLINCKTIEIGGPSKIFFTKLPIYQNLKSLDVVNFSNSTIWERDIREGYNLNYYGNRVAYQYISEASLLKDVKIDHYDALISSHCLEHVANPIKALFRWKHVLKPKGYMVLILPNKIANFDHKRDYTTFEHILSDYKNDIGEDDSAHFDEFIKLFDLSKKPGKKITLNEHIYITKNNFKNRQVHHHVFNKKLIYETLNFCNYEILDYLEEKEDLIIFCRKI